MQDDIMKLTEYLTNLTINNSDFVLLLRPLKNILK